MATATAIATAVEELRQPRILRRRLSTHAGRYALPRPCHQLPYSVEALDLSLNSLPPTLASLRLHVLSYLSDLESRLSLLESPISTEAIIAKGELTIDEARAWAKDGLDMLRSIREDVLSHLPDSVPTVEDVEDFVNAHVPTLPEMRSHLPDFNVRSRIDDVRSRISDLEFNQPLHYVPTLSHRLKSLQDHLSAMERSSSMYLSTFAPNSTLSTLLDNVLSSDLVSDISSDIRSGEETLEKAALEFGRAMRRSLNGSRLIQYVDLPERWRNNPFVKSGYRFIPLHDWPRLVLSLFSLHNETLNIHTHLIPFLFWTFALFRFSPWYETASTNEPAKDAFTVFALVCLLASVLWHTMAGCAHAEGMEFCARVDYVGIGWLISASVGTVVYYAFQCRPAECIAFLLLCLAVGVSGSIVPFTHWFNQRDYKNARIVFFVGMALSSVAPLVEISRLHSMREMYAFLSPIVPSLASYIVGLIFYATHFPECVVAPSCPWLDWLGGGSHAIWHVFIVLAISLHRRGMEVMKAGIGEACNF